jgi:hypothetical protein
MYTIALGALRSMHMTSQPMYIASASNGLIGLLSGYFLTFRLEWGIAGYVVYKNRCPKEESRAIMIAGISALGKGYSGIRPERDFCVKGFTCSAVPVEGACGYSVFLFPPCCGS